MVHCICHNCMCHESNSTTNSTLFQVQSKCIKFPPTTKIASGCVLDNDMTLNVSPCSHMGRCFCQRVIWHLMQLSRALSAICMFCAIYPITTQNMHWANLRWRLGEKQGFCLCTMCGCCVSSCQNLVLTVRHALKLQHKPAAQKHRWCLCKHGCWIETIVLFNWRKIWWIHWSFAVVSSAEQFEQSIGNVQHTCMSAHLCQSRPEQSKVNTVP